jgi:CBS domain containing-hemolysin-like protein
MSPTVSLILAFFLVALNGFFVAAEFALVKVRSTRIEELAQKGGLQVRAARRAVRHLDSYLSATQLGITLASIGLGYVAEPAFAQVFQPLLERAGPFSRAASHVVAVTLALAISTFLHIVFGEQAPKWMAIQRAERTTLWVALPLDFFYRVFKGPIWLLNEAALLVLRPFGLGAGAEHEVTRKKRSG